MALQLLFVILAVVVSSHAEVHSSNNKIRQHLGSAVQQGHVNFHHSNPSSYQPDISVVHHGAPSAAQVHHRPEDNVAEPTLFRHDVANVAPAISKAVGDKKPAQRVSSGNTERQLHPIPVSLQTPNGDHVVSFHVPAHRVNNHIPSVPLNLHAPGVSVGTSVPTISALYSLPDVGVSHNGHSFSHEQHHVSDYSHSGNVVSSHVPNVGVSHNGHVSSHEHPHFSDHSVSGSYGAPLSGNVVSSHVSNVGVPHSGHSSSHEHPHISDHSVPVSYAAPLLGNVVSSHVPSVVAKPSLSYLPPEITASSNVVSHISPPAAVPSFDQKSIFQFNSFPPAAVQQEHALRPIPVLIDHPIPAETQIEPVHILPLPPVYQDTPLVDIDTYAPAYPISVEVNALGPVAPVTSVKSQYHSQDELGQYAFGYNNGDSSRDETRDAYGHVRGSYSYVDSNGEVQSQHYIADDKGFRVRGTNLPVHVTDEH